MLSATVTASRPQAHSDADGTSSNPNIAIEIQRRIAITITRVGQQAAVTPET